MANTMKHITEEYGMKTNLLTLKSEDLEQLEPFLKALGIRCRVTTWDREQCTIQAENPYRFWIDHPNGRKIADDEMSDFRIKCYKR